MKVRFTPPERLYDGYVFDCDGTLADTMPIHFEAWRVALAAAGARFDFHWKLFTSRAGMSLERTVEELSAQFDVRLDPLAVADAQRDVFARLEASVTPIEEVLSFAREVARSRPVAVASGSLRPNVERSLTLIGARELFSVIVTPERVEHGKPFPDMFLLAARELGVEPTKCLAIEDGELGIQAARRAGMDVAIVAEAAVSRA